MLTIEPIVLYSSKGGNTEKITRVIVSELGCDSVRIGDSKAPPYLDDFDLVFVGTGIYWGNPNADLENFLLSIALRNPKTFALFLTWGGAGKTNEVVFTKLTKILEAKGHRVMNNTFSCYGGRKFVLARRGHPNRDDLEAARQWARSVVNGIKE